MTDALLGALIGSIITALMFAVVWWGYKKLNMPPPCGKGFPVQHGGYWLCRHPKGHKVEHYFVFVPGEIKETIDDAD